MGAVLIQRVPNRSVKLQQPKRKRPFCVVLKRWSNRTNRLSLDLGFAENAADTCMGILQIRLRIPIKRQHSLPIKDVILDSVGGKIGVLDCANAHLAGNFTLLFRR